MGELWPKWTLEPNLSSLLDEKWGDLDQDRLATIIRNHRLQRDFRPDISAVNAAYRSMTGHGTVGHRGVEATQKMMAQNQRPDADEIGDWENWARDILDSATDAEIVEARTRLSITSTRPRVLAVAVEYCRNTPKKETP